MSLLNSSIFLEVSGLKPRAYLILGRGFVREEWKSLCFSHGKSITQPAIQSLSQLSQNCVPESRGRILDSAARVELLRQSLKNSEVQTAFPLLLAHRFRPQFYDSLDRALQKGRQFFAHAAEAKVMEARLSERLGFEPRREEFFLLNQYWEGVLNARDFYDEARVLEEASRNLLEGKSKVPVPKVFLLEHFLPSPRLRYFVECLSAQTEVEQISSGQLGESLDLSQAKNILQHRVCHSLEDAAHYLLDEIIQSNDLDAHAVVIEDLTEVRRTLKRVALERGVPLQDPRDPTLLIQSEEIKTVLLELEIVAKNYPSNLVLAWISSFLAEPEGLRKKIIEKGITQGLENYAQIPTVHLALSELKDRYPARLTLSQLIESLKLSAEKFMLPGWVGLAIERISAGWVLSLAQLGVEGRKRPLRIWLEEILEKIQTAPPLVTPDKHARGLKLYRVDQGISLDLISPSLKIHFFGVSPQFFDPREQTSEWFSARDIEILAVDFQIPGRAENAAQAKSSFLHWLAQSKAPADFYEYRHREDGGETESMALILHALGEGLVSQAQDFPVHPQVLPSLGPKLKPTQEFTPAVSSRTELPMSFLSALGNCAFTAYSQHLLQLYDERELDFDLSGDSFGNLVHAAVEHLVASKLTVTIEESFEHAWKKTAKLAWLKSDRLYEALRGKTLKVLTQFLISENEYRLKSGAEVIDQEMNVSLTREGFTFSGRVDRIDQHADGIVLMDYKTGGSLPSAAQTLELSKGLQLPAYALALQEQLNQEVVGAQYIQLGPLKTNRNLGFLFSKWNKGKITDKVEFPLSSARANSGSLVNREPEAVWQEIDQKMQSLLKLAKEGQFAPVPADPKDCLRCRYRLVCGRLRLGIVDDEAP